MHHEWINHPITHLKLRALHNKVQAALADLTATSDTVEPEALRLKLRHYKTLNELYTCLTKS